MSHYQRQDRGDQAAYAAYFAGMDASMQQKVALTTAYFPAAGRIADMGSGSGRGTYDLACLYPQLDLLGIDINPTMVAYASQHYQRPNLAYQVGDIALPVVAAGSLDGVLNSSVLHHVTSFNSYDLDRVLEALAVHVAQLRPGGVLIIRDFVVPHGPAQVLLDLPDDDGAAQGSPEQCSSAALFELFAAQFRSSQNREGGVPYQRLDAPRPGWARFRVALRAAAEFLLRKDYRADWATELIEEYTYLDQAGLVAAFQRSGLRVVCALPIYNPWIMQNRWKGQAQIATLAQQPLDFPPTNLLIAGEKVPPGVGVRLAEVRHERIEQPQFLRLRRFAAADGAIYELAERPGTTIDLIPWFEQDGQLFVLAKKDFPRPIVHAGGDQPNLSGLELAGYLTEPISAILPDSSIDDPAAIQVAITATLAERAGLQAEQVQAIGQPMRFFSSPGGLSEQVVSYLVAIEPVQERIPMTNYTPFQSAGVVRALHAGQLLRACQVGGVFDARLEIAIGQLLRLCGRTQQPWIGAPIALREQPASPVAVQAAMVALNPPMRSSFQPTEQQAEQRFLDLIAGEFAEYDAQGHELGRARFEYLLPAERSRNTVVVLPIARCAGRVVVGIEPRELPAPYAVGAGSTLMVAPAYRLDRHVAQRWQREQQLIERLTAEHGVAVTQIWELGGPYFPTPGVTPEIVQPFVAEVTAESIGLPSLVWVDLSELFVHADQIRDMHLLIALARAAWAVQVA
ncbi:MAG: hypothetical protein Fur005_23090 [Roseiflexaceae bacterium]